MPSQQSQRALNFMRSVMPEQRRCSRVRLPIQATVVFRELNTEAKTAFLRDMNMLGAFCYCSRKPEVGHHVSLTFAFPDNGASMKATCEGVVVRVEEFAPGAAIGVAIEFTYYQIARPQNIEQSDEGSISTPFIGWTVELVERVFTKLQQSGLPVPECEQAA